MELNRPDNRSSSHHLRYAGSRGDGRAGVTRRRLLCSSTVVGALAAVAGCLDDDSDTGQPDDTENDEADAEPSPPFEINTIDARGSESGDISIPQEGTVLVLNFARTQCPTSEGQISTIGQAAEEIDEESVQFLTVNNLTGSPADNADELADWWETETEGDWLIGIDENGDASEYYEIVSLPVTIVIDGDGEEYVRYSGSTGQTRIINAVDEAIGSDTDGDSEADGGSDAESDSGDGTEAGSDANSPTD